MTMIKFVVVLIMVSISYCGAYKAAVVEFFGEMPEGKLNRTEAISLQFRNLKRLSQYVEQASSSGAHIIVLPEYALTGPAFQTKEDVFPFLDQVPCPGSNPCKEQDPKAPISTAVSCLANTFQIAIVIDLGDLVYCNTTDPHCPSYGWYQFNTALAVDNNGIVLAKYHKEHLYYENQYDEPVNQPPIKFYLSSVNVTFGMGICFDILFTHPMVALIDEGVTDFVYPTWWVNTPPILNAVTMQSSWSKAFNINLLAAGSGSGWFNSGSGIYSQGYAIKSYYNSGFSPQNKVFIADVPKIGRIQELVYSAPYNPPLNYTINQKIEILSPGEELDLEVHLPSISCSAHIIISNDSAIQAYSLLAIDGYFWPLFPITLCGIFACPENKTDNCGMAVNYPMEGSVTFNKGTKLTALFSSNNISKFGVVSEGNGQLFSEWKEDSNSLLLEKDSELLNFSFLGRQLR